MYPNLRLDEKLKDDWEQVELSAVSNLQSFQKVETDEVEGDDENETVTETLNSETDSDAASKEQLKSEVDGLNKQISVLSLEIKSLIETINEMRQKVKDVELCRHEASFVFEIENANEFIESSDLRRSSMFYCRGIAWYLTACTTRVNGRPESLSIYLNHNHTAKSHWTIETDFLVALINEKPGQKDKSKRRLFEFFGATTNRIGWQKYTSVEKLKSRGFLKNNRFKMRVELHAKKMHSSFNL